MIKRFNFAKFSLDAYVRKAESDYGRLNPKDVFLCCMDGEHLAFREKFFIKLVLPERVTSIVKTFANDLFACKV